MENENDKGNWQIMVRYTHPLAGYGQSSCAGGSCGAGVGASRRLGDSAERSSSACGPTADVFIDAPISITVDGVKYYYLYDGLGSVTELIDENENVVNRYRYTPFGESMLKIEGVFNPYQFTGRRYDQETGQYYYRARMYSPSQGRFLSQDPLGMVDGPNMYAYVRGDPVNHRDPSGRQQWPSPPLIDGGPWRYEKKDYSELLAIYYDIYLSRLRQIQDKWEIYYGLDLWWSGLAQWTWQQEIILAGLHLPTFRLDFITGMFHGATPM